jgi:hypothetical protein
MFFAAKKNRLDFGAGYTLGAGWVFKVFLNTSVGIFLKKVPHNPI